MTTTELIKILQDNEKGGISHKPRDISLVINGRYMPNPQISLSGTGDGVCGPEIDLDIEGDWFKQQTSWIPVSERLPEEAYGCIVTVMDTNPMTLEEFENIYPDFVGWDGEDWNDADGDSIPFEVIAWMPLPQPYKGEQDEK